MEDKAETLILIPSLPTAERKRGGGKEGDSTLQSSLFINPSETERGEEGRTRTTVGRGRRGGGLRAGALRRERQPETGRERQRECETERRRSGDRWESEAHE